MYGAPLRISASASFFYMPLSGSFIRKSICFSVKAFDVIQIYVEPFSPFLLHPIRSNENICHRPPPPSTWPALFARGQQGIIGGQGAAGGYPTPSHGCQMATARFLELYVFGPSGFLTMAPLHYATKFDPFLSLDCARVEGLGAQSSSAI